MFRDLECLIDGIEEIVEEMLRGKRLHDLQALETHEVEGFDTVGLAVPPTDVDAEPQASQTQNQFTADDIHSRTTGKRVAPESSSCFHDR